MGLQKLKRDIQEERDDYNHALDARNAERMAIRQAIFNEYMQEAWKKAREILTESEIGDLEQYAVMLAEIACVDNWVIPPRWTRMLNCAVCGWMPCLPEDDRKEVICCSWCIAHPPKIEDSKYA